MVARFSVRDALLIQAMASAAWGIAKQRGDAALMGECERIGGMFRRCLFLAGFSDSDVGAL